MKKRISGGRAALIVLVALVAITLGALSAVVVGALGQRTSSATEPSTPAAGATSATATIAGNGQAPRSGPRPAPVVYRPANLSLAQPVALVVALHGSGGRPAAFEAATG